jgi:hypothetical protein
MDAEEDDSEEEDAGSGARDGPQDVIMNDGELEVDETEEEARSGDKPTTTTRMEMIVTTTTRTTATRRMTREVMRTTTTNLLVLAALAVKMTKTMIMAVWFTVTLVDSTSIISAEYVFI